MSELRWHPFLRTWVITATHRQDRTYHPPPGYCPLCPTKPGGFPTEIPFEDYDVVVFENRFPSLQPEPPEPALAPHALIPIRPAGGVCEVVCYASDHDATLATLPLSQIQKLVRVWKERYVELAKRPGIEYVFIFENKGEVIGVTLSHPHGQIYAYPYIPAIPAVKLESERLHFEETKRFLADDWLSYEIEVSEGVRIIAQSPSFITLVPVFARYTYEAHVVASQPLQSLADLNDRQLDELAEAIWNLARRYDRLFGFSMPYIMSMYQSPTFGDFEATRLSVEFFPPHRTAEKLKYLAGSESGAGAFINDMLPEEAAKRLREV